MRFLGGGTCSELAYAKQEKEQAEAALSACTRQHGGVIRSSDPTQNRCVAEVDNLSSAVNTVETIQRKPDAIVCEGLSPISASLISQGSNFNTLILAVSAGILILLLAWWKLS